MKPTRIVMILLFSASFAFAQSDAQKALGKFKSMVGTWEGKTPKGAPVEDTYTLTAGGTTVMVNNKMGPEDMVTMFYLDGDQLMMTHFCPSNNQPRMKATISPDLKTVSFEFLDATNLPSPQAGHMGRAIYLFSDPDHYSEEWTWLEAGKSTTFHFDMHRK
jgi:hypothetical protein